MANNIQFKRRINGAGGAPTGTALEGEIAFNAPGAAGGTQKPDMYFFDGTAWRLCNPAASVTPQSITLGAGANIGQAYGAWAGSPGNTLTGDVIIATYGTPSQAYLLVNRSSPTVAGSWVALGGAVAFASASDIHTGTDTTGAINSAILRGETVTTSAGNSDADKLPRLNASGKLDASMLPATPSQIKGGVDVTTAPVSSVTYVKGDIIFANKDGAVSTANYPLATGSASTVKSGDTLLFDGTAWHVIPDTTDMTAYVPLAGTTQMSGSVAWSADGAKAAGLDLFNRKIDRAIIDCGTY